VTCVNNETLAVGASTTLVLTVAVGGTAGAQLAHSPTVTVDGDLITSDNTANTSTAVVAPFLNFQFNSATLVAGSQGTVGLILAAPFTREATGTLTLAFTPDAAIPVDDPAIQFSTGGRTVNFTIPANSQQARFGSSSQSGPIAFQSGTVSGTFTFSVSLQTGDAQTAFSDQRAIPRGSPRIHSVVKPTGDSGMRINLSSPMREVTQLTLAFTTSFPLTVSCGSAPGCTAVRNTLTLDVKSLFDDWYYSDTTYGSVGSLRLPLSIEGSFKGTMTVSLRNTLGVSNVMSVFFQ
jgi:hypothetical protein